MTDQILPDCPEMAIAIGALYKALGASLHIERDGKRVAIRPEPYAFKSMGCPLPSLPNADSHEAFLDDGEYRGAIKVIEYILARLGTADRDLLFGLLASDANAESRAFDFREQLS